MKTITAPQLANKIKRLIAFFMICLILSGITAFPLEWELGILIKISANAPQFIQQWLNEVYTAIKVTNQNYPFMAYGTDWLAFAHIVIAVAFIGPLRDPIKNIWVIEFGMIACLMIFPLAFICGPIRQIPIYWQLIDCSFGVFGFILLYICHQNILLLRKIEFQNTIVLMKE
jgi:hypothetical protein